MSRSPKKATPYTSDCSIVRDSAVSGIFYFYWHIVHRIQASSQNLRESKAERLSQEYFIR